MYSSAAASSAAVKAQSKHDANLATSKHNPRARKTALGSNPNPRTEASTSFVARFSATEARSHASAASAHVSSACRADMRGARPETRPRHGASVNGRI